jgi:hypothetical protein
VVTTVVEVLVVVDVVIAALVMVVVLVVLKAAFVEVLGAELDVVIVVLEELDAVVVDVVVVEISDDVVDTVVAEEMLLVDGTEVVVEDVAHVPPGTTKAWPINSVSQSTPGLAAFKVSKLTVKFFAILSPSSPTTTAYVQGNVTVWFEHCTDR